MLGGVVKCSSINALQKRDNLISVKLKKVNEIVKKRINTKDSRAEARC